MTDARGRMASPLYRSQVGGLDAFGFFSFTVQAPCVALEHLAKVSYLPLNLATFQFANRSLALPLGQFITVTTSGHYSHSPQTQAASILADAKETVVTGVEFIWPG